MQLTIEQIIKEKNPSSIDETKALLREIIQSIILIGLSRSDFFTHASFYGGTALRVFYGLNRYSEDLYFTLNGENDKFSFTPYISKIKSTALSYGIDLDVINNEKKIETPIESAFAKLNTYQTFLTLHLNEKANQYLHKDEVLKVKFEVDCYPALGFKTENKWLDIPEFAPVIALDEESLFAGKLHAILCRNYKNNVKGRDYYDFLFFMQKRIKPNMVYLRNKLVESKKINIDETFDMNKLKEMLKCRFEEVDFTKARDDAQRFVFKNEKLTYFSKDLFLQMITRL